MVLDQISRRWAKRVTVISGRNSSGGMNLKLGRWLRPALGFLLSAAGLFLVLREVDWPLLGETLGQVKLGWLLAAGVFEMLAVWVNAIRWRYLFWPHHQPAAGRLFAVLNVAQLVNTVLPGRLGLPLRAFLLGDSGSMRVTTLATLAVEKVLEGVTLLPVAMLVLTSAAISGIVLLGLLLGLAGSMRWKGIILAWSSRAAGGRWVGLLRALLDGLDALRSTQVGWQLWGWSWVYWALVAAVNWLTMQALGVDLPPLASLVLLFVLQIGVRIPSLPAGIGVFDYLTWVSLALFGVGETAAFGLALLLRLVFYLLPSLVGVGALLWMSVDLGRLRQTLAAGPES